ncbi:hypothetical protein C9I57_13380 [Trinickia symbiotica]|uniref:Guanylate cyclase domain-containing protein n=1 Tax=Trinickia symbiotica TaxID=863227 RepID=A0A2T3XUC5_9BURK|nr:hypothetical protein C9I57_13380 [Trinickia symbiotica]
MSNIHSYRAAAGHGLRASRMESHGVPGRVQVTDATRRRLGPPFRFEDHGFIEAKGIGQLHTWFLSRGDLNLAV